MTFTPPPTPWQRLKEEPMRALVTALIALEWGLPELLELFAAFGAEVTARQEVAVGKVVTTLLLLLGGEIVRSKVKPTATTRRENRGRVRPAGTR